MRGRRIERKGGSVKGDILKAKVLFMNKCIGHAHIQTRAACRVSSEELPSS